MTTPDQQAASQAEALGLNEPRFENGSALLLAGLNGTYTMETRANIPSQWEQFAPRIDQILHQIEPGESFGVSWNFQPDSGFDYFTGVRVASAEDLPTGLTQLHVDASRYAIFTHSDHISQFPKTIDTIWTKWVPHCNLKVGKGPCIERYAPEFDPMVGRGGIELWIPLEN